jgi:hypothetical protein
VDVIQIFYLRDVVARMFVAKSPNGELGRDLEWDYVLGWISAFKLRVEGLFASLFAQSFDGPQRG